MRNSEDEKYAASFLKSYLDHQGHCQTDCIINCKDPPDIIVHMAGGQRIGVEVTRACQRKIRDDGRRISSVSRAENNEPLWRFSEELGEETKITHRRQDYVLYLEGPPPKVAWAKWRKKTRKCILDFVESGQTGVCKFPGGKIRARESQAGWRVMIGQRPDSHIIGGHSSDVNQNIRVMLRHSLRRKLADLPLWNEGFNISWLSLLNYIPLSRWY